MPHYRPAKGPYGGPWSILVWLGWRKGAIAPYVICGGKVWIPVD